MNPVVNEIACRLKDLFQENIEDFEGLYVFGSQVRGDATDDSDVDIVAVFGRDLFNLPDEFYDILSQMRYDYYDIMDLDIHPKTRQELEFKPFFYEEVVNKRVFYGTR